MSIEIEIGDGAIPPFPRDSKDTPRTEFILRSFKTTSTELNKNYFLPNHQ